MEIAISVLGALVGIGVSVFLGRNSVRQLAERASARRFLRARDTLRDSGLRIREIVDSRLALTRPGWLLDRPVPLDALELRLASAAVSQSPAGLAVLRRYLPVDATGRRLERYHEAVTLLGAPPLWFDANTYRLLAVIPYDGGLSLQVGRSRYWECFDYAEGLRHEAAHHYAVSWGKRVGGPFRRALGDPFDFSSRQCGLGIATLTIRADGDRRTFYLHRRSDTVAVGQNETSLIPAGEFQPSDDSDYALHRDLDAWLTIMREYAEELLDMDEVREATGAPLDYNRQPPFSHFQQARADNRIRPYLLGVGLDPVSWKAQIYTACVFDAPVFDRLFASMTTSNSEGVLELPTHQRNPDTPLTGWDFTEDTVTGYLDQPNLSPSAKLVLAQAWRHRDALR